MRPADAEHENRVERPPLFPPTFLYTQSWEDPEPDMKVGGPLVAATCLRLIGVAVSGAHNRMLRLCGVTSCVLALCASPGDGDQPQRHGADADQRRLQRPQPHRAWRRARKQGRRGGGGAGCSGSGKAGQVGGWVAAAPGSVSSCAQHLPPCSVQVGLRTAKARGMLAAT